MRTGWPGKVWAWMKSYREVSLDLDQESRPNLAAMLSVASFTILGLVIVGNLALLFTGDGNQRNIILTMAALPLLLSIYLLRARSLWWSPLVLALLIVLIVPWMVINWGTIRLVQTSYLFISVGLPTLIYSRRVGLAFLFLSLVVVGVLAWFESSGQLPQIAPPSPVNQWFVFTMVSIGYYVFAWMARWSLIRSISRANRELTERQRAQNHMQVVSTILQHLNTAPQVTDVFPQVIAELREAFACNQVVIDLAGLSQVDEAQGSIATSDLLAGRPYLCKDLAQALSWPAEAELHRQGARSVVYLPLSNTPTMHGYMTLWWLRPSACQETDLPALIQIANMLSLALARSKSYQEAQQRAREAETLRDAAAVVTEALQQEQAARRIMEQLQRVVPHDTSSVMLLRDGALEIIAGFGWGDSGEVSSESNGAVRDARLLGPIIGRRFPVPGDNPNTLVIQQRRPVVLSDAPQQFPAFSDPVFRGVRSWLGIPLIVRDDVIGMLTVDSVQPDYFTLEHVRLSAAFADQVAVVLEHARLYTDLQHRASQLEQAVQELENFSYTISHDLRAPLRAIDGFAHIVLEDSQPPLSAEARLYVERMAANARLMGRLVDDLRVFVRLGQQPLTRRMTSLGDLARQALAQVQDGEPERTLDVVVGDLPAWEVDPDLFQQLFVHLLSNAFKFTRTRHLAHIEIGCQESDNGPVCYVRDNGSGFDMQFANKLFRVFHRLDFTESDRMESTGVGLAFARRIVERHGGRIWVESQLGHGTTFFFTVKLDARGES